ncbi:molybdopterin-dependent oxidoreductase [Marinomonas sp. A79]|uniref:Molybdopterin-dependent oxidoreductase n=1 Tax=Marinomonas vulgaris TaxID=2823372 RepID=A0ABS5H8Y5_9GAMM|nr:molybdopterin-dependent oxidoreductase [Marinomonas vulgaris]MBR7888065.1 molybdopterin-dependent oxidoreductase [Marinomonas vulgaris]
MLVRLFASLLLLSAFSSLCSAQDVPKSRVLLTVSDSQKSTTDTQFDMAMLQRLPQYSVTTHNPWTIGEHTYRGFSAVDLVAYLGLSGNWLQVSALNHYMTEIPLSDFVENGAMFATHLDGKPMSVRNLGPIMVIYPFDERPELKSERYYGRSIWQIERIKLMTLAE